MRVNVLAIIAFCLFNTNSYGMDQPREGHQDSTIRANLSTHPTTSREVSAGLSTNVQPLGATPSGGSSQDLKNILMWREIDSFAELVCISAPYALAFTANFMELTGEAPQIANFFRSYLTSVVSVCYAIGCYTAYNKNYSMLAKIMGVGAFCSSILIVADTLQGSELQSISSLPCVASAAFFSYCLFQYYQKKHKQY